MADDNISLEELQDRLHRAEATLRSLRRGEVDLVIGSAEPLVVRFTSVVEEKERLSALLDIVRRINRLIIYEDDPRRLLQSAVACFGGSKLFHAAWIWQVDESGQTIRVFENGWGDVFEPVAQQMDKGSPPACISKALKTPGVTVILRPETDCAGCPLSGHYGDRCVLVTRLGHRDLTYGVLAVSAPGAMAREKDAHALCAQIGSDIGFAIHSIGIDEVRHKLQEELRQNEERLRIAGKAAYDVIYEWDVAKDALEWFGDIDEKLGYRKGEISRDINAWVSLIHPEDRARRENAFELHRTSAEPFQYEYRVRHKDGVYRHWSDRALPVLDDTGRPRKWVGVCTDITAQVQAMEALAASELRYRTHFENVSDVIWVIDSEFRITDISPSVEQMLGYTPEELVGRSFQEMNVVAEAYLGKALSNVERILRGERVTSVYPFIARDGSIKWGEVNSAPLVRDGRVTAAVSVVRDITERRQAEAERVRLATAIEQAGEAIVITDPEGTIDFVNPAFESMTGYGYREAVGQNPRILKSGKQDDAFYRDLWETITDGRVWKGRLVNKRKDGTLYTEEATVSPVLDHAGQIVNYVAVKRDITEHLRVSEQKAQLTEQLQQAQKLESVGRLAGGVAHDFNNMLTVILGYGENIINQLRRGDPLREDAREIVEAGKRSAALTRQLLAFSRKQALQPEVLDLNAVVRNLDKMLRRLIGEDIDLELLLSDELSRVMADPGQIEQVIMNLAVNARDAMPQGGKLIIETANAELDDAYARNHTSVKPGRYALLAVTDTGCGMDKETMSRVFDPFFTTKERGQGTGLGLSTVYGIVKQSGGNIWIYSEPGQGTIVKTYFPQTEAKREKQQESVGTAGPSAGEHILVVEDEEPLRRLTNAILSRLGYEVTIAANGDEALLLVEGKDIKPDLVLTDVVMPGMSGSELVERLRKKQPDIKVLYMSGYTDNAIVRQGVLDAGTPFIQKPFTIQGISEKVRAVLRTGVGPQ